MRFSRRDQLNCGKRPNGFTLVELLVVLAILGLLVSLVLPSISRALEKAKSAKCMTNLKALYIANEMFADDHGYYVPAHKNFRANKNRWHGTRTGGQGEPFDGYSGPLAPYLGGAGTVRVCPSFLHKNEEGFERSCGGYGYNDRGVGSRVYVGKDDTRGMDPADIENPSLTVMFCDTAFNRESGRKLDFLIEYSFAEAYHFVWGNPPSEGGKAWPSIHFRHLGRANVVWCDGRVTSEAMETEYNDEFTEYKLGWFGGPDNTLFDPY